MIQFYTIAPYVIGHTYHQWILKDCIHKLHYRNSMTAVEYYDRLVYVTDKQPIDLLNGSIVGECTLDTYTLDIRKHSCTCKSWQYVRTGDRNCKHLRQLRAPVTTVTYTKEKQPFQLISEAMPVRFRPHYLFSEKYDGIRVAVKGCYGYTRNGMKIDLSSMYTPTCTDHVYDAELCMCLNSTHDTVMAHVHSGKMERMQLRIFDLIDEYRTLGQRLLCLWQLSIPEQYVVRYHMVDLDLTRTLAAWTVDDTREGVIIRNPDGLYNMKEQRSNQNAFKIKHARIINDRSLQKDL